MAAELGPECEGAGLWPSGTTNAAGLRDLGADFPVFPRAGRLGARLGALEVEGPSLLATSSLRAVFGRAFRLFTPGELRRDLFRLFDLFNGPAEETSRDSDLNAAPWKKKQMQQTHLVWKINDSSIRIIGECLRGDPSRMSGRTKIDSPEIGSEGRSF